MTQNVHSVWLFGVAICKYLQHIDFMQIAIQSRECLRMYRMSFTLNT